MFIPGLAAALCSVVTTRWQHVSIATGDPGWVEQEYVIEDFPIETLLSQRPQVCKVGTRV